MAAPAGASSLVGNSENTNSTTPNGSHEGLARALRRITTLPLEEGNGAGLRLIDQLVLLGERANDHLLHRALEKILRETTAISPPSLKKCGKTALSHFSLRQVVWRKTAGID